MSPGGASARPIKSLGARGIKGYRPRMPELPEVETVMRGLKPRLEGRILAHGEARRPALRWPLPADFARRRPGRRGIGVGRPPNYPLAHPAAGLSWLLYHVHLGRLH